MQHVTVIGSAVKYVRLHNAIGIDQHLKPSMPQDLDVVYWPYGEKAIIKPVAIKMAIGWWKLESNNAPVPDIDISVNQKVPCVSWFEPYVSICGKPERYLPNTLARQIRYYALFDMLDKSLELPHFAIPLEARSCHDGFSGYEGDGILAIRSALRKVPSAKRADLHYQLNILEPHLGDWVCFIESDSDRLARLADEFRPMSGPAYAIGCLAHGNLHAQYNWSHSVKLLPEEVIK